MRGDVVWIPATPEPWHGWKWLPYPRRAFVCLARIPDAPYGVLAPSTCGRKFTDREAYEQHWHRRHGEADGPGGPQMAVWTARARALGYTSDGFEDR